MTNDPIPGSAERGSGCDWWHVAWSTFLAWSPTDERGSWERLAAFYADLQLHGGRVELSAPLPRRHLNRPPLPECVRLSPEARRAVRRDVLDLAAHDRVAGDTVVRALFVGEYAVQALIGCPAAFLQQRVGRLKSGSAGMPAFIAGPRTWASGFWRARLLDQPAIDAVASFLERVEADSAIATSDAIARQDSTRQ